MDGNEGILLTAGQVREWREKRTRLEKEITDAEVELAVVNRQLEAVSVIVGKDWPDDEPASSEDGGDTSSGSMIAAIERIANSSREPLTKAQTKHLLRHEGFQEERLGNYFYTCIKRLKDRRQIHVLPDGRITRIAGTAAMVLPAIRMKGGNAG